MITRETPPHKYQAQINQLKKIRTEIFAEKNPYDLPPDEKKDAFIVLNTLDHITSHSTELAARTGQARTIFFISKDEEMHAPIHLDNYKSGDDGEKEMIGSLTDFFIQNYDEVKKRSQFHVKKFISLLTGVCIDARTRSAFDYAKKIDSTPTFTDHLQKAYSIASSNSKNSQLGYWELFLEIYNSCWGEVFIKDSTKLPYAESDGIFNNSCFNIISRFLKDLELVPNDSFLIPDKQDIKAKNNAQDKVLLQFILSHDNLLDGIGLEEFVHCKNNQFTINNTYKGEELSLVNHYYDNFIQFINFDCYIENSRDFYECIDYLNRASCSNFFNNIPCFFSSENADKENILILLEHYIKRIEYLKKMNSVLYEKIKKEETEREDMIDNECALYHIIKFDRSDLFERIYHLGFINLLKDPKKLLFLPAAVNHNAWQIVEKILSLNPVLKDEHINYLIYAFSANKKFSECDKYLVKKTTESKHDGAIQYHYNKDECALHHVVNDNKLELAEKLLNYYGDSTKKPILISALESKNTTLATLKWIISQTKIDCHCKWRNETQIMYAFKKSTFDQFKLLITEGDFSLRSLVTTNLSLEILHYNQKIEFINSPSINIKLIHELISVTMPEASSHMSTLYQKHPESFNFLTLTENITDTDYLFELVINFITKNIAFMVIRNDKPLYTHLSSLIPIQSLDPIKAISPEIYAFMTPEKQVLPSVFNPRKRLPDDKLDATQPAFKKQKNNSP